MALYKLTGVSNAGIQQVFVNKQKAEENFLIMVNMNLFNLKDLYRNNPNVTNGTFRTWYISQGYNWNNFLNIINA